MLSPVDLALHPRLFQDTLIASRVRDALSNFVVTDKGCWEHPTTKHNVRLRISTKQDYLYRWIFYLVQGPFPDGAFICHTCDNRLCVNPHHLFLGTAAVNNGNARDKGRIANRGASVKNLTPPTV